MFPVGFLPILVFFVSNLRCALELLESISSRVFRGIDMVILGYSSCLGVGTSRMTVFDPTVENVVVAIVGPTGVGKSSFIKTLTGAEDIMIGHGLTSGTTFPEPSSKSPYLL